ncbi:MAG: hypothetical protein B6244_02035 [Candidatus Cloacimonetes bacterium 4572_55]|nr:MAG: hypothetical protein B6244_02035 [Candidatus Cloacimonetes bacterium 4572_55]
MGKSKVKNIYALTPLQEGMLFHSLYEPDSMAYFEQSYYHILGALRIDLFQETWRLIVCRHDILRTVFLHKGVEHPLQVVLRERKPDFYFEDLRPLSPDSQSKYIRDYMDRDQAKLFDLSRDALMRIALFQLGENSFDVVWSLHHIVMDGWSLGVIQDELFQIYNQLLDGKSPKIPSPPPFSHYVKWLKKQDKSAARRYWRAYLAGYDRLSSFLPPLSEGETVPNFQPHTAQFFLDPETTSRLRNTAAELRVTLNTFIQTVWSILLGRRSGLDDVIFAATVSGRPPEIEKVERMVGLFINAAPVRARLSGAQRFDRLARTIQQDAAAAKPFHYGSLADIQSLTRLKNHLFDHILVFENYPIEDKIGSASDLPPGQFLIDRFEHFGHTNYDLTVQVAPIRDTQGEDAIRFHIIYNRASRYSEKMINSIEQDFRILLDAILQHPDSKIDDLPKTEMTEKRSDKSATHKVAIAATFTSEPIAPYLEWWTRRFGLTVDVGFAPYNQIFQQLLDSESLFSINTGANILLVRFEDWLRDQPRMTDREAIAYLQENFDRLTEILSEKLHSSRQNSVIFVGIFPPHPDLPEPVAQAIHKLNSRQQDLLDRLNNCYPIDFSDLANAYHIDQVFDPRSDEIGHLPYTDSYFAAMGTWVARRLIAWRAPSFKVIALDCDNTLWQGVCGEDGADSVKIIGPYLDLQRFLIQRHKEGYLLVLCSKNNEQDVWQVFEKQPDMPLKREHIVAARINWRPKSDNLREIAEELNLGLDSFIFIDDSPMECTEMTTHAPQVLTLNLPDFDQNNKNNKSNQKIFADYLAHVWAFDKLKVTEEDRGRTQMYQAETRRTQFRKDAVSLADFLKSLDLELNIAPFHERRLSRISQLTQRTNQFNLTVIRRTEEDIRKIAMHPLTICRAVEVKDRFGDYGLVGLLIAHIREPNLEIDTFLLSCRVLGRGVERAILSYLKELCRERGLERLIVDFFPTERNQPARIFLQEKECCWQEIPEQGVDRKKDTIRFSIAWDRLPDNYELRITNYELRINDDVEMRPGLRPVSSAKKSDSGEIQKRRVGCKTAFVAHFIANEEKLTHRAYYLPLKYPTGDALLALFDDQSGTRKISTRYVPPQDDFQKKLARIWRRILGVSQIGIDDDFLQLGGHSLTATRAVSAIHKEFQAEISLKSFFDHPTVRELSWLIQSEKFVAYAAIEPLPKSRSYDVSPSQRRLWILDQMEENFIAYNLSAAYLMEGELDAYALEQAFRFVINRHESLRAGFFSVHSRIQPEPRQRVNDQIDFRLPEIDFSGEPDPDRAIREHAQKESVHVFDLSQPPLLRVRLYRTEPRRHVLLIVIHHIICDGWSMRVLENELLTAYRAYRSGETHSLPPLPIQYKDYAAWAIKQLSEENEKSQRDKKYWHKQLSGEFFPSRIDLPTDYYLKTGFSRPSAMRYQGCTSGFPIPTSLIDRIKRLQQSLNITLFVILLGAVKILLHRYTQQEDILIGSPVSGRVHPDLEDQIGFYVNTLVLRTRLRGEESVETVLSRIKETVAQAQDHQLYPFDRLVDELNLPTEVRSDVSRSPLFDVMVALQNIHLDQNISHSEKSPDLKISDFRFETGVSQFDLTFNFFETPEKDALYLEINYNSDLFLPQSVERMFDQLRELLQAMTHDPRTPIGDLNLGQKMLTDQISAPIPRVRDHKTLAHFFETVALEFPNRSAVITGQNRLTYSELNERADRVASLLREKFRVNLHPYEPIAVRLERGDALIIALLAILKSGGTYLPIDPAYPSERTRFMLEDSRAPLLIEPAADRFEKGDSLPMPYYAELVITDRRQRGDLKNSAPKQFDGLAYIIYTSGSTGVPKGVMVEHQGFINMVASQIDGWRVTPDDRVLQFSSPSFDASLSEIFMALLSGAALIPVDRETIEDPDRFIQFIEQTGVTVATLPPVYLNGLRPRIKSLSDTSRPLSSLKTLITAGEPAIPEDVVYFSRIKNLRYINAYGPTECSVCATYHPVDPEAFDSGSPGVIPIGKPIPNIRVYLLDSRLQPTPDGAVGEVCLCGPGVARGYLNRPEQSTKKFIENPFISKTHKRLYRTGDLGRRLSDGSFIFMGRIDDQVKIRGYRIEPEEICHRLLRHPSVKEAIVTARSDGEDIYLAAYVVWNSQQDMESDQQVLDLRAFLIRGLPDYMIPAYIVPLEKLPVTTSGKIDRKQLPNPRLIVKMDGSKSRAIHEILGNKADDSIQAERIIADIWQKALGLTEVGVTDNYFMLGGDSIKSIRIVSLLRDAGFIVQTKDIFMYQTVAELAAALRFEADDFPTKSRAEKPDHLSQPIQGEIHTTPTQRWFFSDYPLDQSKFIIMENMDLGDKTSRIDAQALRLALEALQNHHDALRMRYRFPDNHSTDDSRRDVIQENVGADYPLELEIIDLRGESQARQSTAAADHIQRFQTAIDLRNGPMMRASLLRFRDRDVGVWTIHHLVVDAVSWQILTKDLRSAYNQAANGEPIVLPEKTTSFMRYAELYRNYEDVLSEREYWRRQRSSQSMIQKMRDKFLVEDRDLVRSTDITSVEDRLQTLTFIVSTPNSSEDPRAFYRQANQAMNARTEEILLTALMRALQETVGVSDAAIMLEGHGRDAEEELDITRTVGWFTVLYPVRLQLPDDPRRLMGRQITQIQKALQAVPGNGSGYGVLRYIELDKSLMESELPTISFNYLGEMVVSDDSGMADHSPIRYGGFGIEINCALSNGELHSEIVYDGSLFHSDKVKRLSESFVDQFKQLTRSRFRSDL